MWNYCVESFTSPNYFSADTGIRTSIQVEAPLAVLPAHFGRVVPEGDDATLARRQGFHLDAERGLLYHRHPAAGRALHGNQRLIQRVEVVASDHEVHVVVLRAQVGDGGVPRPQVVAEACQSIRGMGRDGR